MNITDKSNRVYLVVAAILVAAIGLAGVMYFISQKQSQALIHYQQLKEQERTLEKEYKKYQDDLAEAELLCDEGEDLLKGNPGNKEITEHLEFFKSLVKRKKEGKDSALDALITVRVEIDKLEGK